MREEWLGVWGFFLLGLPKRHSAITSHPCGLSHIVGEASITFTPTSGRFQCTYLITGAIDITYISTTDEHDRSPVAMSLFGVTN